MTRTCPRDHRIRTASGWPGLTAVDGGAPAPRRWAASTGCGAGEVGWDGPLSRGCWGTSRSARSSAWSLVAGPAVADVGAAAGTAEAIFAAAIAVFTVALLGVGPGLRRLGPRRLFGVAAAAAGAGLGTAASWDRPVALWAGPSRSCPGLTRSLTTPVGKST